MKIADLRGSIDSADLGLLPNASDDQTAQFQNAVNRAVERGRALFLPAGTYPVANLRLPSGTLIVGVPGKTRLVYQGGGGQLIRAEGVSNIGLQGITFDGANRSIGDFTEGVDGRIVDTRDQTSSLSPGICRKTCRNRSRARTYRLQAAVTLIPNDKAASRLVNSSKWRSTSISRSFGSMLFSASCTLSFSSAFIAA